MAEMFLNTINEHLKGLKLVDKGAENKLWKKYFRKAFFCITSIVYSL